MVTEDYVSYEMAMLLKEKGFDGDVDWYYPIEGGDITQLLYEEKAYEIEKFVQAPSLAMAMKHVRERGWYIDIRRNNNNFTYFYYIYNRVGKMVAFSNADYPTYEKASDEALRHIYTYLI